jgi:nickel-dependent lactate racemase
MATNTFTIMYGQETQPLMLPAQTVRLAVGEQPQVITPDLFRARLTEFLRRNPLDLSRPCLVVADKTRLCGYPQYLPPLVDILQRHGMAASSLKVLIAYGAHARQSDEECRRCYGETYDRFSFVHHDCRDGSLFAELGATSRGVPIRLRRDLLAASCVITMGAISHHYFAGYGGDRKLVFPGCGEQAAIYANHALYLDRGAGCIAAGCQPGQLDGNPLAEDLFEIEERLPASLAVHGILDGERRLCDLLVGAGREDFLSACASHHRACATASPQFDLVVASCGGFPKDINFIQSHKALHNAAMFVKDGGLLLLYAECRDGVGSTTFLPWLAMGFTAAFRRLAENYEGNGGTALATMTKMQRIRIGLVTALDAETCRLIGGERWEHRQVVRHLSSVPAGTRVACIANASLLVRCPSTPEGFKNPE